MCRARCRAASVLPAPQSLAAAYMQGTCTAMREKMHACIVPHLRCMGVWGLLTHPLWFDAVLPMAAHVFACRAPHCETGLLACSEHLSYVSCRRGCACSVVCIPTPLSIARLPAWLHARVRHVYISAPHPSCTRVCRPSAVTSPLPACVACCFLLCLALPRLHSSHCWCRQHLSACLAPTAAAK